MEPDSPVSIVGLRDVLNDVMEPVQSELASIRTFMSNTSKKLDTIARLQDQLISLSKEKRLAEKEGWRSRGKGGDVDRKASDLGIRGVSELKEENRMMKEKILENESQARRVNLVFIGVRESKAEICEETILNLLTYAGFEFDIRSLERAHRLGPYHKQRVRPIVVRFQSFPGSAKCVDGPSLHQRNL